MCYHPAEPVAGKLSVPATAKRPRRNEAALRRKQLKATGLQAYAQPPSPHNLALFIAIPIPHL